MADLPPMRLTGAEVLRPEGLSREPITVEGGQITDSAAPDRDLTGYMILPGIVDLHGDGFERHLAPRRGALESLEAGLRATDAELAANGITTGILAQFFSWEGGMRGPEFAAGLATALSAYDSLTDMRLQLRLEVNMIEDYPQALQIIKDAAIPYVVFNDHLPHNELSTGKTPPRLIPGALKAKRAPEAHHAYLQALHDQTGRVPAALSALASELRERGTILGSHDDTTTDDRAQYRAMGARIAEFPETRAAAEAAHAAGDTVIMGAPNVMRGGSHKKNQRASDLIADGLVDALVSDYHYPAPHLAAFKLVDEGMGLAEAWAMISRNPARVLGLDDRGDLSLGKRADMAIIHAETRRIEATICAGQIANLSGALASRMISP